jgi:hypothetical protein
LAFTYGELAMPQLQELSYKQSDTYSTDEYFIALLNADVTSLVAHVEVGLSLAVGAECSVQTEGFQTIAQ